ncbi:uncharacterized protein LOC116252276 isoform X1 [Nymphaea colorata]|uniref:uncharacterized protein LOC116252276 isoform X1 n=1 Tax=Nymphaea colorata TaxID=210225 RepID=UPI00129E01D2|nr:uncharacterized protein LOC116252276 isoform X1 [Nymphaea colorata]
MTHRRFSLDRFPVSGNHKGGTCRRTGAFSGTQQISDRREAATAATLSWAAGHVMATSGLDGSWTSFKINMENFLLGGTFLFPGGELISIEFFHANTKMLLNNGMKNGNDIAAKGEWWLLLDCSLFFCEGYLRNLRSKSQLPLVAE